jgi:hypothetical protein
LSGSSGVVYPVWDFSYPKHESPAKKNPKNSSRSTGRRRGSENFLQAKWDPERASTKLSLFWSSLIIILLLFLTWYYDAVE